MQKYYLASDHAGYKLKDELKKHLESKGFEVIDLGPNTDAVSISYVDQGKKLGEAIMADPSSLGAAVCGTGIGISIALNKVAGIRAARIVSVEDAHLCKQHNDANVVVFGGRQLTTEQAIEMIDEFNATEFEGGRHLERVEQLNQ